MSTALQPRMTFEEYVAWEEHQVKKHEYFDGQVYAMAGATYDHDVISDNLKFIIRNQKEQTGCRAHGPDLKVRCPSGLGTYPDVVVVCDQPQFADGKKLVLLNPQMIFEVLSPSTMAFDRGEKFEHYQSIPSLKYYVLVSSARSVVQVYRRQSETDWNYSKTIEGVVELNAKNAPLKIGLAELYADIEFPKLGLYRGEDDSE